MWPATPWDLILTVQFTCYKMSIVKAPFLDLLFSYSLNVPTTWLLNISYVAKESWAVFLDYRNQCCLKLSSGDFPLHAQLNTPKAGLPTPNLSRMPFSFLTLRL